MLGVVGSVSSQAAALHGGGGANLYLRRFALLGLSASFTAALLYICFLKGIPLSGAFPSVSLSCAIVSFLTCLIWKECFEFGQIVDLLPTDFGLHLLLLLQ